MCAYADFDCLDLLKKNIREEKHRWKRLNRVEEKKVQTSKLLMNSFDTFSPILSLLLSLSISIFNYPVIFFFTPIFFSFFVVKKKVKTTFKPFNEIFFCRHLWRLISNNIFISIEFETRADGNRTSFLQPFFQSSIPFAFIFALQRSTKSKTIEVYFQLSVGFCVSDAMIMSFVVCSRAHHAFNPFYTKQNINYARNDETEKDSISNSKL